MVFYPLVGLIHKSESPFGIEIITHLEAQQTTLNALAHLILEWRNQIGDKIQSIEEYRSVAGKSFH